MEAEPEGASMASGRLPEQYGAWRGYGIFGRRSIQNTLQGNEGPPRTAWRTSLGRKEGVMGKPGEEDDFGPSLAILRMALGWKQEQLAEAAGIWPSALSDYEQGKK